MDLSKEIMKGRSSKQQQQTVSGVLGSLMPPEASARFRKWFPVSKVLAVISKTLPRIRMVSCITWCSLVIWRRNCGPLCAHCPCSF